MENRFIRQRAIELISNNLAIFLVVGFGYTLINQRIANLGLGFVGDMIRSVCNCFVSASSACFYLRAYNKGMPEVSDIYEIFTYSEHLNKLFSIMIVLFVFNLAGEVLMRVSLIFPILSIFISFRVLIISYLLNLVWYLFVTNPRYPTDQYIKASMRYVGSVGFRFIWFLIATAFPPALIIGIVSMVSTTIGSLFSVPLTVYIGLATAGFVSENMIPDEWYSGFARFD